ncbi:MAG: TPM domain-containing protein [Saprospiraceae bacterium]
MPKQYFSASDSELIAQAVKAAEGETSGEIRIFIESNCLQDDVLDRTKALFVKMGLEQTKDRNGILVYIAMDDRKFAIYGDQGIHQVLSQEFWNALAQGIALQFAEGEFVEGLVSGVGEIGKALKEHFPYANDDVNELPDEIVYGD